ncbi:hypothetical protein QGM71_21125 [Virgibacillus sp. C22-A2]|uniref:DUF4025 domain-containing protein n=1 Tax=Virgibacillus tibetensis TaxID=3042313 RepID=A0ABU6KLE7_9BACI|nr:hypothetical protein [Virgibacillus sp. C22-A2]
MDKRKGSSHKNKNAAPGIDEEDSYGTKATNSEIQKGDSTRVTRLINDELDPSGD